MEYQMIGVCSVTADHTEGTQVSTAKSVMIDLMLSDNIDEDKYFGEDDLPNELGSKAITISFVQGLVANIHSCHQRGIRDSAEHLRYIISELEKGFVAIAEVTVTKHDD